jgi:formiminotetrahydrofolate cyclodeaminase
MPAFSDLTVTDFLDALASAEPTPGGGTAAAVAGAIGASLLMMVAGLAKTRTGTATERDALLAARAGIAALRTRLLALADEDSAAYNAVLAAFRLPKDTAEEKAARSAAVQLAFLHATETPLDTLRVVSSTLALGAVVADGANRSAASDVGVAIGLLEAAAAGGAMNVRTNLGSLKDEALVARFETDVATINEAVVESAAAARASLGPV